MNKPGKIVVLVLTALPLIMIAFGIYYWVKTVFDMVEQTQFGGEPDDFTPFFIFFGVVLVATVLSIIMTVYYVIHTTKNQALPPSTRTAWILINIFIGSIGHLIYFFQYIWNERAPHPENTPIQ